MKTPLLMGKNSGWVFLCSSPMLHRICQPQERLAGYVSVGHRPALQQFHSHVSLGVLTCRMSFMLGESLWQRSQPWRLLIDWDIAHWQCELFDWNWGLWDDVLTGDFFRALMSFPTGWKTIDVRLKYLVGFSITPQGAMENDPSKYVIYHLVRLTVCHGKIHLFWIGKPR